MWYCYEVQTTMRKYTGILGGGVRGQQRGSTNPSDEVKTSRISKSQPNKDLGKRNVSTKKGLRESEPLKTKPVDRCGGTRPVDLRSHAFHGSAMGSQGKVLRWGMKSSNVLLKRLLVCSVDMNWRKQFNDCITDHLTWIYQNLFYHSFILLDIQGVSSSLHCNISDTVIDILETKSLLASLVIF